MHIDVKRRWFSVRSTIGEMFIDGVKKYYTLEPITTTSDVKPRSIPCGTYDLTIRHSPRFEREMPHIENVHGFEGILIHWGNFPEDTEGCTLIGGYEGPQPDFIGGSKHAFGEFFELLKKAEGKHTITYAQSTDPKPAHVAGSDTTDSV
jgi:hypothetical protein